MALSFYCLYLLAAQIWGMCIQHIEDQRLSLLRHPGCFPYVALDSRFSIQDDKYSKRRAKQRMPILSTTRQADTADRVITPQVSARLNSARFQFTGTHCPTALPRTCSIPPTSSPMGKWVSCNGTRAQPLPRSLILVLERQRQGLKTIVIIILG